MIDHPDQVERLMERLNAGAADPGAKRRWVIEVNCTS